MFTEAAANAALSRTIDAAPATARAVDAPIVRLNGGAGPTDVAQVAFLDQLDAVSGTTSPQVLAFSVGQELVPRSVRRPVVIAGDQVARARLAGVQDPAAVLQVVAADGTEDGVWLPRPVAETLGVGPGDPVQLAVETLDGRGPGVPSRVAGVYEVGAGGRRPADPQGSSLWSGRRGGLPPDTDFETLGAFLAVTDLATADDLAVRSGDELFWTAEVRLDPAYPTLSDARRTVSDIDELGQEVVDPRLVDIDDGPLRLGLASGVERIVTDAEVLAEAVEDGTRTVGRAGVLGVVRFWGPPGDTTSTGLLDGLVAAGVALVLALLLVALTTAVAAALAARPVRAGGPPRRLPWRTGLVLLATATVVGVAGRPERGLGLGPLDLLAPLPVAAATGAVGSGLLALLARRSANRSAMAPGGGRLPAGRAVRAWPCAGRAAAVTNAASC